MKPNIDFLKLLAIFSMLVDHVNHILFNRQYYLLTAFGRLAFPLFAFILAYNFYFHTRDQLNYLKRVFIFALISQPFFILAISYSELNIFFTLGVGMLALYIFNRPRWQWLPYFIFPALYFSFLLPKMDYGVLGILLVYTFGMFVKDPRVLKGALLLLLLALVNFKGFNFSVYFNIFSTLLVIPVIILSARLGTERFLKKYKYWFYAFYPAHLFLLWAIKTALLTKF